MLPRWLENLLTPCPRHLRQMGYLREVLNIQRRHEQWPQAWRPHQENTRQVLLAAVELCPQRRRAVVFGSGPLLDVPLAELAGAFREVVLVDILHPVSARWRQRRWANVRRVTADVTGTVAEVYRRAHDAAAALPRSRPELFVDDGEVDLAASVNLLSQLPYFPEQYLLRAGAHEPAAILAYAQEVIRAHLAYLQRLPGVATLVADVEQQTVTAAGRVLERVSTLYGVDFPWQGQEWTWQLVPRRGQYPHHGYHRRVVGIVDVKRMPSCRNGPS
jgi:hypothetical protein